MRLIDADELKMKICNRCMAHMPGRFCELKDECVILVIVDHCNTINPIIELKYTRYGDPKRYIRENGGEKHDD